MTLEPIAADSATVKLGSTGFGGSGFARSTTVGAAVEAAGGDGGDVGALSIVSTVGAVTSDLVLGSLLIVTVSANPGA